MQWSDIPFRPEPRTLRQFAVLWIVWFAGLAAMHALVWSNKPLAWLFLALALSVGPLGLAKPSWIRWVFVGWMVCVFPIGWTFSRLLLAVLFYGLFAPLGLLFRLTGRDTLQRRRCRSPNTYWAVKPMPQDETSYFHQS
jgi:hypothetical protein